MVVLLRRMLFPLIRKYFRLFLSMVAVSCLGIALMVGLRGAYFALEQGFSDYLDDYGYADVCITTGQAPASICEALEALEGVTRADGRAAADLPLRAGENLLTARVFSFTPDSAQQFYVRAEAEETDALPALYVEAAFAQANGISAGDELELKLGGDFRRFRAQKIVSAPEALKVQQNAFFFGNNSDFGYVYLPSEHMQTVFGSDQIACQFLLRTDPAADASAVLADAEALLRPYRVLDSFAGEDSPVRSEIRFNLEPLEDLSLLLPPLFFAVMLLVVLLFLLQIIQLSRSEIGVLKTFGFGAGQIAALFFALCFCVTLPAIALGIGLGHLVMRFAAGMYAEAFWLPPFPARLQPGSCAAAAVCTVLTGQLAAAIGCRKLGAILPHEVLHGKDAFSVSPARLDRLPKRLGPMAKLSAAVVLRNGRRFLLSAVCIAAAMMLIVSAISFDRSKDYILEELFEKHIDYDCQIYLDGEPAEDWMEALRDLPGVSGLERLDYLPAELSFRGQKEEIILNAPADESELLHVLDRSGVPVEVPESGIVLERHLAERLGAGVGDNVLVNGQTLTVTGLSSQCVSRAHYVSQNTIHRLGDAGCSVLVHCGDEGALRAHLAAEDGCQAVFTRVVREDSVRSFRAYSVGVYIVIAFALGMSLMIVMNRMKSSLMEQRQELATMRVLGVFRGEITLSWLLQSLLQYALAALVGLPAGAVAARLILREMSTARREYPFADRPREYALAAGVLLLFVLLGHFLSMRKLKGWNLAEMGRVFD